MASTCISNCVDARAPVRATYVNLYKWPESDVEFVRSLSSNGRKNGGGHGCAAGHMHPKVVDSISCRQLYLRSYTFSRDDELNVDKRKRSCGRFRDSVAAADRRKRKLRGGGGSSCSSRGGEGGAGGRRKKRTGFRRAREMSCVALAAIFRRLLSCTTKVDVRASSRRRIRPKGKVQKAENLDAVQNNHPDKNTIIIALAESYHAIIDLAWQNDFMQLIA